MRTTTLVGTCTLLAGLAACSTDSATGSPFGDAASPFVNADVAMVATEALGQDVEVMRGPGGLHAFGMAAERGKFECSSAARDGLTATRTCVYKDAAGTTQATYDSLTTASVSVNATVTGTVTRGPMTMTIDRTSDFTVSGLAGRETSATWNGGGRGTVSRVRSAEDGSTREYNMSYTVQRTNVVVPVPRTLNSWPTSGTVTKSFTVTVVGGPNDGKTTTRTVVITFNGTSSPTATINGEVWELDLTNRGRRRMP